MHDPASELLRIPLPRTPVNKGYVSWGEMIRGLHTSDRDFMLPVTREKRVEAKKLVPHVGTFWGEWSQWRNRLPQA
jgi:hypothetical protein